MDSRLAGQSRFRAEGVRVVVPATSANLGPGFDTLGLALSLADEVTARVRERGYRVAVTGQGATEVPTGRHHLIVRTILRTFDAFGVPPPPGLELTCHNRIPHARGLGSSSAAIVAGILLARALLADGAAGTVSGEVLERFDDATALRLAAQLEGHPDNVAPCLLGGLTIAWTDQRHGARAVRRELAAGVRPMVFIPTTRSLTAHARSALPGMVPHGDAAFNAARSALLVHALTTEPSLLLVATEDRLHQQYRAPDMPQTAALVGSLRQAGVPAVVSGAGPSVLALVPQTLAPGDIPTVPEGWSGRPLSVSLTGARILMGRHAGGDPVAAGPLS